MMKRILFTLSLAVTMTGLFAQSNFQSRNDQDDDYYGGNRRDQTRIQLALILDTSGSMDDLIDQARGQMWSIVNEILYSSDENYGQVPMLEIALYEYGSSRLSRNDDYIALRVPFTTDLDWVADELFALRTGGRTEYHGAAVSQAVNQLNWSRDPRDLRMVFIAGNESFRQGPVDFRRAMAEAQSRDIIVNTIFCGDDNLGRRLDWEEAAYLGGGEYLAIDSYYRDNNNYDPRFQSQLMSLNTAYNATYIPYGAYGYSNYQRLCRIDNYAVGYGQTVIINRTLVKVSPIYVYPDWDLVDAYRLGRVDLTRIPVSDLPPNMRGMNLSQRQAYLIRMQQERDNLRNQINRVATPRRPMAAPVSSSRPAGSNAGSQGSRPASQPRNLDQAVSQTVRQQQARRASGSPAPVRSTSRPSTQEVSQQRPATSAPTRSYTPAAPQTTSGRSVDTRTSIAPQRSTAPATRTVEQPAQRTETRQATSTAPATRTVEQPAQRTESRQATTTPQRGTAPATRTETPATTNPRTPSTPSTRRP